MAIIIGRAAVIAAEEARITHQVEADRRLKLSAAAKASRLHELRPQLRQLLAMREVELRAGDGPEGIADPEHRDAEMFLLTDDHVPAIAQGEEVPT